MGWYSELEVRAATISECQPLSTGETGGGTTTTNDARSFSREKSDPQRTRTNDPEGLPMIIYGFSDPEVRRKFVTKVYGIVSCLLLLTLSITVPCFLIEEIRVHISEHYVVYALGPMIPILALTCALQCCCLRTHPLNLIMLFGIALLWGIAISGLISKLEGEGVLIALGITAVTFLVVTLVSATMKWDVTGYGFIACMLLLAVMGFGLVTIFIQNRTMNLLYACGGCLVSILFIAIDTQMIVGGGRRHELSPEDYVLGALMIYLDLINLFLYLLRD